MSESTRHSCRKRQIEVEDRIEIMKVEKWYSGFPLVLEKLENGGNEKFFRSWKRPGILPESRGKVGEFCASKGKVMENLIRA